MPEVDHDLLIVLKTKMDDVLLAIENIKEGTSVRIQDHENRLRRLEHWVSIAVGGILIIQAYLAFIK